MLWALLFIIVLEDPSWHKIYFYFTILLYSEIKIGTFKEPDVQLCNSWTWLHDLFKWTVSNIQVSSLVFTALPQMFSKLTVMRYWETSCVKKKWWQLKSFILVGSFFWGVVFLLQDVCCAEGDWRDSSDPSMFVLIWVSLLSFVTCNRADTGKIFFFSTLQTWDDLLLKIKAVAVWLDCSQKKIL